MSKANIVIASQLLATYGKPVTPQAAQDAVILDPVKLVTNINQLYTRTSVIDSTVVNTITAGALAELTSAQWPFGFFSAAVRGSANGQVGWIRGFTAELVLADTCVAEDQHLRQFADFCQLFISSNGNPGRSIALREGLRFSRNLFVPAAAALLPNGQPDQDPGPQFVFQSPMPWACQSASKLQLQFTHETPDFSAANMAFFLVLTVYPVLVAASNPTDDGYVKGVMGGDGDIGGCVSPEQEAARIRAARQARRAAMANPAVMALTR